MNLMWVGAPVAKNQTAPCRWSQIACGQGRCRNTPLGRLRICSRNRQKQSVFSEPGTLRIVEREVPEPGPGLVRIRVGTTRMPGRLLTRYELAGFLLPMD